MPSPLTVLQTFQREGLPIFLLAKPYISLLAKERKKQFQLMGLVAKEK
jgi:hypothetical protein